MTDANISYSVADSFYVLYCVNSQVQDKHPEPAMTIYSACLNYTQIPLDNNKLSFYVVLFIFKVLHKH